MHCYPYGPDRSKQDYSYTFALLLLISSIVIADPSSQLNLPDNFNSLTVDDVLTGEENWREPEEDEIEWRETKETSPPSTGRAEVRWGAQTPYENDNELNPIVTPSESGPSGVVRTPEIEPQFQIRFFN